MKTITSALLASFVAVAVHAQNSVPSVNAAGYIKVTCEPNKFQFVQNPFNAFDGQPYTLSEIIGTSLPSLSFLYVWDSVDQNFDSFTYIEGVGLLGSNGLPTTGPLMARGQGFYIQSGQGANPTSDVFLFGEVPGATSNSSTQSSAMPGFNAVGFPYPVATLLSQSGLDSATDHQDLAYLFNPASQTFQTSTRINIQGVPVLWDNDFTIPPGGVVFIRKYGAQGAFVSNVPYSWPNN